ncbi:MAG: hypothetical protein M1825_004260 [Sarcosagium campestre]|nr:MAG: hypothetical protein M1825_004260 [Sarcosagium campestre]
MDVYYAYTYSSFAWNVLQAGPLLVSPTIITTLLSPEVREPSVPLTSSFSDAADLGATTDATDPKAPYALPTLTITSSYHAAIAFFCYTQFNTLGSMAFLASSLANGGLASIGLWCILFASSDGKINRESAIDERTSGFPFGNKEADKKRKDSSKSQ